MSLNEFPSIVYKLEDAFQNQVDYYLEHHRRIFCWHDFHSAKEITSFQAKCFERKLRWALFRSGFEITSTLELWPPKYVVSEMGEKLSTQPDWSDFDLNSSGDEREEIFAMSSEDEK